MPPSEPEPRPFSDRLRKADWRGWLALAWVVWFGLHYGKMVVEQRGGKLRDAVRAVSRCLDPTPYPPTPIPSEP
jgi:hypothetical protein